MASTISSELRWLLDRAAEGGVYVRSVLPETLDQVAQWNAPCPRWRSKDVFAALRELERLGWIRFFVSDTDDSETPVTRPEFKHQALIDAYKSHNQPVFYRFSDAGAAVWEQAANPDWTRWYVSEIREPASQDEEGECVVTAMTEDVARRALLSTACWNELIVVPGTERYMSCGSWKATYWKDIACGVQAVAVIGQEEREIRMETLLPLASQRRVDENIRMLGRWYAPVEEPNWQHREYLNYGGMWGESGSVSS